MDPKILGLEGETRVQTLEVSYAVATAAATKTDDIQLDESYEKCLGVALIEITDGDLVNDYDISLEDGQSREVIQQVNKQLMETSKNVGQLDKVFPVQFKYRAGEKIKVKTTFSQPIATDALNYHMVFLLWRSSNPNI